MLIYSERNEIKLDPPYQRMGGVWTKEKRQLLIDSILNDYDIPKIYFHSYSREQRYKTGFEYAVIDGRQRLETIWDFIDGKYTLANDFTYQRDPSINLAGLSYNDIALEYPRIKIKFDSFVLPVISVDTDDEDLIDDMFYRLNEAVPLNAAEKRNSIGGDLVKSIIELSEHDLFKKKVKFGNKRYQHREVSARFLLMEDSLRIKNMLIDTKKVYLDALARKYHSGSAELVSSMNKSISRVLDKMCEVFADNDDLLRSQGNITIYFLLFKFALNEELESYITRKKLIEFNEKLKSNRQKASEDYENSSFELLEYDRLSQQGTNDSSNIRERLSILMSELKLTK